MKEISFPSYHSFCDVALVSRDFKSKETSGDQTGRVSNSNMTKWSPIRSVIIRVINKIGRPRS